MGATDLLNLVEMGRIQVMARPEWIYDKKLRNSDPRWAHARWNEAYDPLLRKLADASAEMDPASRAVRIMPPERGLIWSQRLKETGRYYKRAEARYRQRKLPAGILSRADSFANEGGDPVQSVLRDAKDHEDAFVDSGAWAPLEPSSHPDAVTHIMGRPRKSLPNTDTSFDRARLVELLRMTRMITHLRSGADLLERIKQNTHDEFAKELSELLCAEGGSMPHILSRKVRAGLPADMPRSALRAFLPHSTWDAASSIGGLLTGIASASLATPWLAVVTGLAFLFWGMPASVRIAQATSLARVGYTGPRLPFMLAFGSTKPNLREIRSILQQLEALL